MRVLLSVLVAVGAATTVGQVNAQVPQAVADWLVDHAKPLPREWASATGAQREMMTGLFDGKAIVGLGEGTHGTSEFLLARALLVNAAIATGRPLALAWESDVPAVAQLGAALDGAPDDLAGATEVFRGFPWRVREMYPLLAAVRSDPRARVVGVDIFDLAGGLAAIRQALAVRGTALDRGLAACLASAVDAEATGESTGELDRLGPTELSRLAACADLASEHLIRTGAAVEVVLSAAAVAQRARHLVQFTELLPFENVPTLGEAIARWRSSQAAARRSAERLIRAELSSTLAEFVDRFRDPGEFWRGYVSADRTSRAQWRDASRRLVATVWAREVAGVDDQALGLREAADSIRQFLDVVHEGLRRHDERQMLNVREAAMAANVLRFRDRASDSAIVGWAAHHFHVNRGPGPEGGPTAGTLLAGELGSAYLAVGMLQATGAVLAIDRQASAQQQRTVVRPHPIDSPRDDSWEAALAAVPHDLFLVDLRSLPDEGPVAEWFRQERRIRWIGNTYDETAPENYWWRTRLRDQFDVVIFVREGHPTTPTPVAAERFGAPE